MLQLTPFQDRRTDRVGASRRVHSTRASSRIIGFSRTRSPDAVIFRPAVPRRNAENERVTNGASSAPTPSGGLAKERVGWLT